ncbi:MAG: hypothetical protein IJB84_00460 [Lachnospiraceae bacterium]|nr:hypothetical protein [Lachnospiraceae bacterium]
MNDFFGNLIVKDIVRPCTTPYERGLKYHIEQRNMWGLSLSITGKRTYSMNGKTHVCDPSTAVLIPQGATYCGHDNTDGLYYFVDFTCDQLDCSEIVSIPLAIPITVITCLNPR